MNLELVRFAYTPTETQGRLYGDGFACYTIERPWVKSETPGGKPFESCIPDGEYDLVPFLRPSGVRTFAMVNPDLGVFFEKPDGRPGRYLCLIHSANFVNQVNGCVAPGAARRMQKGRMMVTSSRLTMSKILERVSWRSGHSISIRPALGANDGA